MTDLLQLNLQIIQQRWPEIAALLNPVSISELDAELIEGLEQTISVNGLQLSSRHGRQREASLLAGQLPKQAEQVHIYGVGMGDLPIHLLETGRYPQITLHLMNLSVFKLLLTYTNQSEWLTDPRIALSAAPDSDYPKLPNVSVPPELTLCDEAYASVRDLLMYELNRHHINSRRNQQLAQFSDRVAGNIEQLKQDPDISVMAEDYRCNQALIIAPGPTLEGQYQTLLRLSTQPLEKRPLLIALDTACRGLNSHGIHVDVVVTLDELVTPEIIQADVSQHKALVYFCKTNPELIAQWQGPRFNAHTHLTRDDELASKLPKTRLFANGSVILPAVDLAIHLGAKEISLIGADFGFPGNKPYAYWQSGNGMLGLYQTDTPHWVLDGNGSRLPTALNLRAYLRSLEHLIAKHPEVKVYRTSKKSAMIKGTEFRELTND